MSRAPKHPAHVDAVVGRTAADHIEGADSPGSGAGSECESPPRVPASDFERELLSQLDLIRLRLEGEEDHLAQVEHVVSDYLPPRHLRLVR